MILYLNGNYISDSLAELGIHDAGFLYGHGVYETLRTYDGKLKYVAEHFERLTNSARIMQIPLPLKKPELSYALEQLVQRNSGYIGDDLRFRITLTAGTANFVTNTDGEPTLLITAKPVNNLEPKPLTMVSYKITRIAPEVKSTSMIANILAQKYAQKHSADEALLVTDDGYISEGSFCNIFVVKSGQLYTPANNILGGITRDIILRIAKDILPVQTRLVSLEETLKADEAFITSSVRGVVPVSKLDTSILSLPGEFTTKIQKLYKLKVFGRA